MKPVYKTRKVLAPHCPKCKKHLYQDNSMANPWQCDCGTWVSKGMFNPTDYEVLNFKKEEITIKT